MISEKNKSKAQIFLLLITFVLFIMLANNIFKGFRFDLTENKLYTLGDGTLNIINKLDDQIILNYYFSDSLTQEDTYLRAYAKRIKELLEEYQLRSKGKIKLNIIDPLPFSDEEDDAMKYGLQGVPSKTKEENIFFGLVAANRYDSYKIIKFFDPGKEAIIEYEITKVLYSILEIKKPKIGVMTSLPLFGGYNFTKNEPTPEWAIIQKLKPLFDIELIDKKTKSFEEFEILFLVHPKKLSDENKKKAIDFYDNKGRILVLYDVYSEADPEFQDPSLPPAGGGIQSSDFQELLDRIGVSIDSSKVLLDRKYAIPVTSANSERPIKHAAILSFPKSSFNKNLNITNKLNSLTSAFSGSIINTNMSNKFTPLISSSSDSSVTEKNVFRYMPDPSILLDKYKVTAETEVFAGLIENQNEKAIVIADADITANYLWVRVQDFYGEQVLVPWASNGDLIINSLDYLSGGNTLASITSRESFSRPFTVVEDLKLTAEKIFNTEEARLQNKLALLQSKNNELTDKNSVDYSAFQQELLKVRKELRDVRRNLNKEIDGLGSILKFVNIFLMPILLTIFIVLFSFYRKKQKK
ncbi:Gldg family protein [Gammaproteobacteria bacterium]|nr:Gldg family protein [Gammaproteobacteria bacterium]